MSANKILGGLGLWGLVIAAKGLILVGHEGLPKPVTPPSHPVIDDSRIRALRKDASGLPPLPKTWALDETKGDASSAAVNSRQVLSQAQLRACVELQANLRKESEAFGADEAQLRTLEAEEKDLATTLKREEPFIDRYSQQSVDAFNDLVQQQSEGVVSYNLTLARYKEKGKRHGEQINYFNAYCGEHYYYESDMRAVTVRN